MYVEQDRASYYIATVEQGDLINTAVLDGVGVSSKARVWGFHTKLAFYTNPAEVINYNPPLEEGGVTCVSADSSVLKVEGTV